MAVANALGPGSGGDGQPQRFEDYRKHTKLSPEFEELLRTLRRHGSSRLNARQKDLVHSVFARHAHFPEELDTRLAVDAIQIAHHQRCLSLAPVTPPHES